MLSRKLTMDRGDLVWFDGFYHKEPGKPEDYALPGVILKQVDCELFEIMVSGSIILVDIGMIVKFEEE